MPSWLQSLFVFTLFLSVFRLDETLAGLRSAAAMLRPARGLNKTGASTLRDPDGRPLALRTRKEIGLSHVVADFHSSVEQPLSK
jgi:hypothetical protein